MKCKEAEKWILRSLDRDLEKEKKISLEEHVHGCGVCQQKLKDYQLILKALQQKESVEPLPYFWERLQPKLKEKERLEPWSVWQKWSIRAIPVSLILIFLFLGALIFLIPKRGEDLSQAETFLLRNANPLVETRTLFEEEKLENRNMMIIFAAMDEQNPNRRFSP